MSDKKKSETTLKDRITHKDKKTNIGSSSVPKKTDSARASKKPAKKRKK